MFHCDDTKTIKGQTGHIKGQTGHPETDFDWAINLPISIAFVRAAAYVL